jgi:hypothetical protein
MNSLINSASALGLYRSEINLLAQLGRNNFENIFRMYTTENNQFFYNILNGIKMSSDLVPNSYYTIKITKSIPWTVVSYNEYATTTLWWLICLANDILNPIEYPVPGTTLKIVYPELVKNVINEINTKLNNI